MKKGNVLYGFLFGLLMALLFASMLQKNFALIDVRPLNGVTVKVEKPVLDFDSYSHGKYQSGLENYIAANFGFREPVIRLYNQYVWSFFHKTYCHFIVIGKEGYLYYAEAVNDFYGTEHLKFYKTNKDAAEHAVKEVRMMNKLRYVLKDYGIEFLAFMAPDKAVVYPEYLPKRKPRDPEAVNMMQLFDKEMNETGFPHVEMSKWFQSMKDTASFMLFPKTDSHWRFSAIYGYDSLFSYMNSLNNFGIPDVEIGSLTQYESDALQNDEQTLNLMFPIHDDTPKHKADISIKCDENCHKPKVLFIGDSFVWDLETFLPWKEILEDVEIWFYNSTAYVGFEKEKYNVKDINRLRKILNNDFIVWYSNGHQWSLATYGFVEDALLQLCVSDSLFNAQIPWVMDSLRNDSVFMEKRWNMAKDEPEKFEALLTEEAQKTLKADPELIEGLRGDSMPTIRNEKAIQNALQINAIANDKPWMMALRSVAMQQSRQIDEILEEEAENVLQGRALLRESAVIDTAAILKSEKEKLIRQWRDNPETMKFLHDKAKEQDKPFETVLEEDAKWIINQQLKNGELF